MPGPRSLLWGGVGIPDAMSLPGVYQEGGWVCQGVEVEYPRERIGCTG